MRMVQRLLFSPRWLLCLAGALAIANAAFAQSAGAGESGDSQGTTGRNRADERILDFVCRFEIASDDSVVITDTIRVVAAGKQIKRGIYRDLPLRQDNQHGGWRRVDVKVLEIKRDGKPDANHAVIRGNFMRLYVGRKDYFLPHGVHTYTIKYRLSPWVLPHADNHMVLWEATAASWPFPIEQASATVVSPPGTRLLGGSGDTGAPGRRTANYTKRLTGPRTMSFRATKPLRPGERLLFVVGFTKHPSRIPAWRK
jgi:hypothetical protein